MKKINLILASVLICTLVSARGIDGPIAGSSVAVTNIMGSTVYKLYYKSEKPGWVKVSIIDEDGKIIFDETLNKVDGFLRPYNFDGLKEGQYTIHIQDESGKTVEKVDYNGGKVEKFVHIEKLATEENKYMVSIASPKPENVFIYIFDAAGNLIHNEIQMIEGEFAQVYNLKDVKSFSIEIADKFGVLKKIDY